MDLAMWSLRATRALCGAGRLAAVMVLAGGTAAGGLAGGVAWAGSGDEPTKDGAGVAPASPAATDAGKGPAADEAKTGVLEVLSTGQEPRRQLRLTAEPGRVFDMTMGMKMSVTQKIGDQENTIPLPESVSTMAVSVTDVAPDGEMTITMGITDMTFKADASGSPAMAAAAKAAASGLKGTKVSMKLLPTGTTRATNLVPGEGMDKQASALMESLTQSANQMAPALPTEAMGVGGKWRQSLRTTMIGITMEQITEFTVVGMDDRGVDLELQVTQTASEQDLKLPGMPMGDIKVRLLSSTGTGTGTMRIEPGVPVAARAQSSVKVEQTMRTTMGEMVSDVKQISSNEMTLRTEAKDGGGK